MRLYRIGIVAFLLAACAPAPVERPAPRAASPPRVILFIGDGAGVAYWSAARFAREDLAVGEFTTIGLVDTRSASSKVTDSAAGATTYATGVRTYNGAIGVGPDTAALPTVLELAEERGLATGLVATSSITHATPAAFAAHVPSRGMEPEIASQLAEKDIEVLLGGGLGFFTGALRPDSLDLLSGLRSRYAVVTTPAELAAVDPERTPRLLGLFAEDGMPPAAERELALPEMTRAALGVLGRDPDGFFLMVEASQPDWRGHGNASLDEVTAEMLDLDRAVRVALEYRERHPETLIVVLADHETGGLALETDSTGALVEDYTTDYHTAEMVPLFAAGPGAERFGTILPNTRVGELLFGAVRGDGRAAGGGPRID